jgi:hypothetical protein
MDTQDTWAECAWDAGRVRELVAGLVKSVIQARWKTEPGFLPDDQLADWFPPDGREVRDDRRSAEVHLRYARRDICELQRLGVLPREWRCSASLVPGPAIAGELVAAAEGLLAADFAVEDPAEALRADAPGDWARVVDWAELPRLRGLLVRLPPTPDRPPAVVPEWLPDDNVLRYGGRLARRVDPNATNLHTLLDAFNEARWAARIDSPFHNHAEALHDTLKRLRRGLAHITFRSERGGTVVRWLPVAANDSRPRRRQAGSGEGRGTRRREAAGG